MLASERTELVKAVLYELIESQPGDKIGILSLSLGSVQTLVRVLPFSYCSKAKAIYRLWCNLIIEG